MVFVSSHGDERGKISASDSDYCIKELINAFLPEKSPTLVGKPKLFFIQACRGDGLDAGALIQMSDEDAQLLSHRDDLSILYSKDHDIHDKSYASQVQLSPDHRDVLVAYSTCEGYYSFRSTVRGSWFIQDLVGVLLDNINGKYDLLGLLTQVNRINAYLRESLDLKNLMYNRKKQMTCFVHTLTKQLYLLPLKTVPNQSNSFSFN